MDKFLKSGCMWRRIEDLLATYGGDSFWFVGAVPKEDGF